MRHGKPHPQPARRYRQILRLAAPLRRFRLHARGTVREHDGGLNLVPMLPARPGAARMPDIALGEQGVCIKGSRMHGQNVRGAGSQG